MRYVVICEPKTCQNSKKLPQLFVLLGTLQNRELTYVSWWYLFDYCNLLNHSTNYWAWQVLVEHFKSQVHNSYVALWSLLAGMHQVADQLLWEDLEDDLHRLKANQLGYHAVRLVIFIIDGVRCLHGGVTPVDFRSKTRSKQDHPLVRQNVILERQNKREQCMLKVCVHPLEPGQKWISNVAQIANPSNYLKVSEFRLRFWVSHIGLFQIYKLYLGWRQTKAEETVDYLH